MPRTRNACLFLTALTAACLSGVKPAGAGAYNFSIINVAGATNTVPRSINASGQVVG